MPHDVDQQLGPVALEYDGLGGRVLRCQDSKAVRQDGQQFDVLSVQQLDHDVDAAGLPHRVLGGFPECRVLESP